MNIINKFVSIIKNIGCIFSAKDESIFEKDLIIEHYIFKNDKIIKIDKNGRYKELTEKKFLEDLNLDI
jgi:hypothetical protein